MNKRHSILLVALLFSGHALAAPVMKEGKWQITAKMEMPGMPMQMPAHTATHCLTKKNMVPKNERPDQECKKISSNVKGNTATWQMECQTPQGVATMDGTVTYKGDNMEGVIKIKQAGSEITQRLSGKRIGECTK